MAPSPRLSVTTPASFWSVMWMIRRFEGCRLAGRPHLLRHAEGQLLEARDPIAPVTFRLDDDALRVGEPLVRHPVHEIGERLEYFAAFSHQESP